MHKRHIAAHDLFIVADVGCGGVRVARLHLLVHFDIVLFGSADDALLLGDARGVPRAHIVDIFLSKKIAAALVRRILVAYLGEKVAICALRIFGAVHKADDSSSVVVFKAADLLLARRDVL